MTRTNWRSSATAWGIRAVEEILERARETFDIVVVGAEPHVNYNRILLSSVLAGERISATSSPIRAPGTKRTASS